MKTYLVTGGAGFIGSNFVLYMLREHADLRIVNLDALTYAGNLENLKTIAEDPRHIFLKGDICDEETVKGIFAKYDPDIVVNFAAESHVDRSITDPFVFVRSNVMGTMNLLNIARDHWRTGEDQYRAGTRFHQVSTDEVYGSLGETGLFSETSPLDPHSPYAASKTSADMFVKAYADTFKMPVSITRCSNNYGPFQFPEKLIPLMIRNAMTGKKLPVYGDGLNVRDWIHVDDHCHGVWLALTKGRPGAAYNFGGDAERSNIDVVKRILEIMGKPDSLIRFVKDRPGHDRRYAMDFTLAADELGFAPKHNFEDGLAQTIAWYQQNGEWLDAIVSGAYLDFMQEWYGRGMRL